MISQGEFTNIRTSCERFHEKYNVSKLVYYEQTTDVFSALTREKEMARKRTLGHQLNPHWNDLSNAI